MWARCLQGRQRNLPVKLTRQDTGRLEPARLQSVDGAFGRAHANAGCFVGFTCIRRIRSQWIADSAQLEFSGVDRNVETDLTPLHRPLPYARGIASVLRVAQ